MKIIKKFLLKDEKHRTLDERLLLNQIDKLSARDEKKKMQSSKMKEKQPDAGSRERSLMFFLKPKKKQSFEDKKVPKELLLKLKMKNEEGAGEDQTNVRDQDECRVQELGSMSDGKKTMSTYQLIPGTVTL